MSQSAKLKNKNDLASEQCYSETSENVMFVYKQFLQIKPKKSKDDQKIELTVKDTEKIVGKDKIRANPKRIQSLKKVFKGLGLSGRNLVVDTNLQDYTSFRKTDLTPCLEVDDETCAKILQHHGLGEIEDVQSSMNSFATLSEKSRDSVSSSPKLEAK